MTEPERELIEMLLQVFGAHMVVHPAQPSFEKTPGDFHKTDVDVAVHPLLLMNGVLMWGQRMHPSVELMSIGVDDFT